MRGMHSKISRTDHTLRAVLRMRGSCNHDKHTFYNDGSFKEGTCMYTISTRINAVVCARQAVLELMISSIFAEKFYRFADHSVVNVTEQAF